jgi:predicted Zn-ribbon and HTH transcriptional regulator
MNAERDVLDRFVTCGTCGWVGKLGKVMAKDVLRCPKCNSAEIGYVVPAHDSNRQ